MGKVDIANVVAIVVIPDLSSGPVVALDLEDLSRFDGGEGRDVRAGRDDLR